MEVTFGNFLIITLWLSEHFNCDGAQYIHATRSITCCNTEMGHLNKTSNGSCNTNIKDKMCAILEKGKQTIVGCPRNRYIDEAGMQVYTVQSCPPDRFLSVNSKYRGSISYTLLNNSAVSVPNNSNQSAIILFSCSDESCAILEPEYSTTLVCPNNLYLDVKLLQIYTESRSCCNRSYSSNSRYKSEIDYTPIHQSAIQIKNRRKERADILYKCTESLPYSSEAETISFSTETHDTKAFVIATSTNLILKGTNPFENIEIPVKFPVGGIVGGIISFFVAVIIVSCIIFRVYRRPVKKDCMSTSTKTLESATKTGTTESQNEYFQLDPSEYNNDITKDPENLTTGTNHNFMLGPECSDQYARPVKAYQRGVNKLGKDDYTYTSVSDQESTYASKNDVYDHLGKTRKNASSEDFHACNTYGHLGTAVQDECTYTSTYDHVVREKIRDKDGLYDISQRHQTEDEYDTSANTCRTETNSIYIISE